MLGMPRHRDVRGDVTRQREIVRVRVAHVTGNCFRSVLFDHRAQAAFDLGECLVPTDLAEPIPVAHQAARTDDRGRGGDARAVVPFGQM